ncbi:uncharacterized protein [Rutidosis leptorrhynchoides]|uniref:uncharacterized protein n=1 Tax=Rutidosis leptorrhynchoides TaxID=125765 RepID=UPI003A991A15
MERLINLNSKKSLTNEQRQAIYQRLLQESSNGKLRKGSISDIANSYDVYTKTISRIWGRGKLHVNEESMADVSLKKSKSVGRKKKKINFGEVKDLPFRRQSNIRSIANSIGVSKSTLQRRVQEGALRPHTNAVKPDLTEANKMARLEFCFSKINRSLSNNDSTFDDMFNVVHIDEKWFYLTKSSRRYYLVPGEDEPLRICKSKKFITKFMFLAAVVHPRFDASGNEIFSGKIGIFPFTTLEPAKRSSKNRVAGTLETKPIFSVMKEVTRTWLIEKVLPTIRAKWPQGHTGPIFIQQDNAKPHINVNDSRFLEEASRDGFDIRLCFQPPNSPDLNVLDLGFFRAIQSLQEQESLGTIDELISGVRGGNNYQTPHIGKGKLERQGNLPLQID